MFSNSKKTVLTIAGLVIASFLNTGCNGNADDDGYYRPQANFVDNNKIFSDYEYPKAGGVTKDYLMTHCSNYNILIEATSINGITQYNDDYWLTGSKIKTCRSQSSDGKELCQRGDFDALIRANHISAFELRSRYSKDIDPEFIACGKPEKYPHSDQYFIYNLYQDDSNNGYLALYLPEYISEVKLAHFKKFANLVHDNSIHSPDYQRFKETCNLFSGWNPEKFSEQIIDREKCRELFIEYGSHYTQYSGFNIQRYEQLPGNVKVIDVVAAFDKQPGDPEYYMVSA